MFCCLTTDLFATKNMKNLLVSFSGGETSAFMAQWLKNHHSEHGFENVVFVFANTGLENEQTLEFVQKCDEYFKLNVHWIEASVVPEFNVGTQYVEVDFKIASRTGKPFEQMIKKYGIPNRANPQCTRELKERPIQKFAKNYFKNEKFATAIGIRFDEIDRVNAKYKDRNFLYPLIHADMIPSNKQKINFFWKNMPFRLDLKGYQGNCITCWKKSNKKLYQIAKENDSAFDFMIRMEHQYGNFFPPQRIEKWIKEGKPIPTDITFFRNNRSALQIIEESKSWNGTIANDAEEYNYQTDLLGGDSCEVFSECR